MKPAPMSRLLRSGVTPASAWLTLLALTLAALLAAVPAGSQTGGGQPAGVGGNVPAAGETVSPPTGTLPADVPPDDAAVDGTAIGHGATEDDDGLAPRERYNESLAALGEQEYESSAAGFLAARDQAGTDTELRYRAAFNLGLALARQSEETREEAPQQTIETLRQAAAWFRDAVRLRPEDQDSRVNLELVLRRIQLLADELNRGQNTLRARLDRVIDDQRGLRDRVRNLLTQVERAGAEVAPVAFQAEYEALAVFERTLLADSGTVIDLAGDELSGLENKTEEERTDEDRVRIVQLLNLDHYLQQARQSLSDARRQLRRLEGDRALGRAGTALEELKRARDQLLDPVTILKSLVEDQTVLFTHTGGLEQMRQGAFRLEGGDPVAPPPWLDGERLGERQVEVGGRHGEVLARFQVAVLPDSAAATPPADAPPADPQTERMLAAAREAVPHLEIAAAAMTSSSTALAADQLQTALAEQGSAIDAMLRAIERFAAVRELIELAYRDQSLVVALLTPPDEEGAPEELKSLSTEERIEQVRERSGRNRERLERLQPMLLEERTRLEQELAGAGGMQPGAGGADPATEQQLAAERAQQQVAIEERFELAEELRQKTADTIDTLDQALARVATGKRDAAGDAVAAAIEGQEALEELRRLFFSVVEHLKELLRNQTETHDATANLQATDDVATRAEELGPLTEQQQRHLGVAGQLAEALAEQADAAAQSQGGQGAEELAGAAAEVRGAGGEMWDSVGLLTAARDSASAEAADLEPALEHQLQAMEHLETAIRLLEPPSQQQQQQEQQQQQQPEEEISQRQAERRLQAIREREAERQRRREQQRTERDPVEKDW